VNRQVVDEASSRIGLSNVKLFLVHADHSSIRKISSKASQEYEAVGFWIVRLTKTSVEAEPSALSCRSTTGLQIVLI